MESTLSVADYPSAPQTTDPRIPPRDHVVVRDLIERWNRECPEKVFVKFDDNGEEWTYAQLRRMVGADHGITDALFKFPRPLTGGYFWCPPVRNGRLDLRAILGE